MKRTFSLLVVTLSAALLLSACSSTGGPIAAKVGSTTISRRTLDDDLRAITDNTAVTKTLTTSLKSNVKPADGGVSTQLATLWLTTLVNQAVVDQYFDQHHLKVTAADRAAAKTAVETRFVNAKTFAQLPRGFRTSALARQARVEAVQATVPKPAAPSDALVQQTFDQSKAQLCPSGQAVAQIQLGTEEEANAIETQLAAGADFGELAKEKSADAGSGAVGGLVACTDSDQYNQLPASFRAGSDLVKLGQTSPPVHTEFGWHVIRVEPFDLTTARPLVIEILQQQQTNPMTKFINNQLLKRRVWVDPRYGTVHHTKTAVAIIPPRAPDPKSSPPEPTTPTNPTTPTTTPAAGATTP